MLEKISEMLSSYMAKKQIVYKIDRYASGNALLDSRGTYDIIFLDIQMGELDGLQAARQLRKQGANSLLIFVTVLKDCVFDAFEVQAHDFLVKPLDDGRFVRTMERAFDFLKCKDGQYIVIQKGNSCQVIPFSQIVYCEVIGRKVYIHQQDNQIIDYYDRLNDLEKRVDGRFYRCHRSYLVNLDYVRGCAAGRVLLARGVDIPASRLREKELSQALLAHMKARGF